MLKNDVPVNSACSAKECDAKVVLACTPEEKKFQICEVCGHANPENAAMCEMCSNYLILGRGD